MKKFVSIFFAFLILLSGMNLSVAAHLCGGELSAIKISFSHEKASCGMCEEESNASTQTVKTMDCCKDQISFFEVDHNYNLSTFQFDNPNYHLVQAFCIPSTLGDQLNKSCTALHSKVQPPGRFFASAVNLSNICVFRI